MVREQEFLLNGTTYRLMVTGDTMRVFDNNGALTWKSEALEAAHTVSHIAGFSRIYGAIGIIGVWINGLTFNL